MSAAAVPLDDALAAVAQVLGESPWPIDVAPVEAVDPPRFVLLWGDPWLLAVTYCQYRARVSVMGIAARLEPGEGIHVLNAMTSFAVPTLVTAGFSVADVGQPLSIQVAANSYLAVRIPVDVPITFEV